MMLLSVMSSLMSFVLLLILVLMGVAFLTLLERKILGYIQIRKGPNKVGFGGILQPFGDAIKLFTKENTFPIKSNYMIYYFCPIVSFIMIFIMWSVLPYLWILIDFSFGLLFLMVCFGLGVYGVMVGGWSSNSNYALLGGLRAVAQAISYEVSLSFILMNLMIMCGGYNLMDFQKFQELIWFIFCMFPLFQLLFVSMLAETNRTPFDFAEGESELVSGFNVEYSSGGFALIFLAEYASIILMSFLISLMFFGSKMNMMFYLFVLIYCFMFIWIRGSLPRYRYDKLMNLCWKSFLPISMSYMIFYMGMKSFLILYF